MDLVSNEYRETQGRATNTGRDQALPPLLLSCSAVAGSLPPLVRIVKSSFNEAVSFRSCSELSLNYNEGYYLEEARQYLQETRALMLVLADRYVLHFGGEVLNS